MSKVSRIALFVALFVAAALMAAPTQGLAKTQTTFAGEPVKYMFFFIGDGLGLPQRTATEMYTGKRLSIDEFPAQGITTTYAADRFITGSAASATALAAGLKTNINYVGLDPNLKPVKTVAEMAKEKGMKVGILSSVSIDHATPAAFYAKVKHRGMYHDVDKYLVESGFDLFAGGGLKDPEGKRVLKKNPDAKVHDIIAMAKDNGYVITSDKTSFMALKPGQKAISWNAWLQDSGALPYTIDQTDKDISLPEFTEKAIELLDNDKGFFLMVEGGKIDWACHANDATSAITNTIDFDKAVQKAVDFYHKHPNDTTIIVVGDHECGGLTLGFAGTKYETYFDVLSAQNMSFQQFTDTIAKGYKGDFNSIKPLITKHFGLKFEGDPKKDRLVLAEYEVKALQEAFDRSMAGDSEKSDDPYTYLLYGDYDPLTVKITHTLNQKAGLAWTSYKHTGVPVPLSAMGVGSDLFNGYYDNTDVAKKIMALMGVKPQVYYSGEPIAAATMAAN